MKTSFFQTLIAVLISATIFSIKGYGQAKTKQIAIYGGGKEKVLETHRSNIIIVNNGKRLKGFLIESSQGRLSINSDSTFYFLDSLVEGKVVVSVFNKSRIKRQLVTQKEFTVITTANQRIYNSMEVKPIVSIGDFKQGNIPLDSIKKVTRLSLNDKFQLIEAVVYITGSSGNDTQGHPLYSLKFDNSLKAVWKYLAPGFTIGITATVKNIHGINIELPMLYYTVVQ